MPCLSRRAKKPIGATCELLFDEQLEKLGVAKGSGLRLREAP